jgi:hypothetical protein
MLATHDSLTSYPIKSWWLKPFAWTCKCQDKTLEEQHAAGARSFDLRFAKYKGKWYAAHGAMIYNITLNEVIEELSGLEKPVYFRVLCEDTFYRKSDAKELASEVGKLVRYYATCNIHLSPLYVRSKRTWELTAEYTHNRECANYDTNPLTENDRDSLCAKVAQIYELQTSDDKLNFIGCYESAGIPVRVFGKQLYVGKTKIEIPYPRLAAKSLTPIALRKKWKENDVPVVDFI